jgi:two-component system nitrogen regulation response regulator GlnG
MQSVVRRSLLNATGTAIVPECLPDEVREGKAASKAKGPDKGLPNADLKGFIDQRLKTQSTDLYAEATQMMERYLITRVLKETGGNQSKAAEILGITRGKIRDRIATFGISLDKDVHIEPPGQ